MHMGTLIKVQTPNVEDSDAVFTIFSDLDQKLSTYKPDSEISRLNRGEQFDVSPQTLEVLERSLQMEHLTGGAFDITVGAWSHRGYRFGYEDEKLMNDQQRDALRLFVGGKRIHITHDKKVLLEPETVLDLGGIAKGYAVDLAVEALKKIGANHSVVSASGDIGCMDQCTVMIQSPFVSDGYIGRIDSSLPRLAVSTSGNYERYIKSKANNHLLDPKTGRPQQKYASVTLISDKDNTKLDALATAVTVMEEEQSLRLLKKEKIDYILIHNDRTCIQSHTIKGIRVMLDDIGCKVK